MTKDRIRKLITLATSGSFALGFLGAQAAPAAAAYFVRMSGTVCQPNWGNSQPHSYEVGSEGHGLTHDGTSTGQSFVCPVPDNTDISKTQINQLDVWVKDLNATWNVGVRACAFAASSMTNGSCSTFAYTSTPGITSAIIGEKLSPGLTELVVASETAYLWVDLPPVDPFNGHSGITFIYFQRP
jgi:hypothetical protein